MFKKKSLITYLIMLVLILSTGCSNSKVNNKYIDLNDNLIFGKTIFTPQPSNILVKSLGEQSGKTDKNTKVYSIEGEDESTWLCTVNEGILILYRNQSSMNLSIDKFEANNLIIKTEDINQVEADITDLSVIKKTISDMVDSNLVNIPESIVREKRMYFQSSKFTGFLLEYYLIKDQDNNYFIVDDANQEVWKIGDQLEDYIQ